MSDDLIAFYRARLDETERIALDAPRGPWVMDDAGSVVDADGRRVILAVGGSLDGRVSRWPEGPVVDHIARHDPARVLADVEAKRQTTKVHFRRRSYDWDEPGVKGFECAQCCDRYPCVTLRLLALPYADHPEFREEWRP